MDTKITLSFYEGVIQKAKKFADENNISLSRLTEFLTSSSFKLLDALPVSEWVTLLSERKVEYVRTPSSCKQMRKEYYTHKKSK